MSLFGGLHRRNVRHARMGRLVLDNQMEDSPSYGPIILRPHDEPTKLTAGSLYFDEDTNQLGVADGSRYELLSASSVLESGAGAGITAGVGTIYLSSVERKGALIVTTIFIDLTGLSSGGTAGDVIGVNSAANCHIGRITAGQNGTIVGGRMTCLETPAGGEPNIDLYSAPEATLSEDAAISGSTGEVALLESSGDWVATGAVTTQSLKANPADDQYLYLVAGDATSAAYTTGQFVIELFGQAA